MTIVSLKIGGVSRDGTALSLLTIYQHTKGVGAKPPEAESLIASFGNLNG